MNTMNSMDKEQLYSVICKRLFLDDIPAISHYVKTKPHCSDEVAHILRVADEVCKKSFLFDLRWDMERTYEPVEFEGEIDWLSPPGDDYEWVFAFNRHRFWICLGQAYAMTGDERYAKAFAEQLVHWVENVPRNVEANSAAWRTIEAGLRMEYWIKAFSYFESSAYITHELCRIFLDSIRDHAQYLMEVYDSFRLVSNWGVLQNHGLFIAGVLLEEDEYINTALERLAEEITIQVYADGVHWEQSPMYHNEVLHCYLDVKILCGKNGILLPGVIDEKLLKMCYASMYHKKPNHMELAMGDSDDIDVRDLISKGAYLYGDSKLKFAGYEELDFDCIWDLGINAAEKYRAIKPLPPKDNIALMSSGNFYLRSGFGEKDSFFHFHCGTLGAGHGHSDKLHIDLFANGEDILIDAGRYTYVNKPIRHELKSPQAHNSIIVDGINYAEGVDSWECKGLSRAVNTNAVFTDKYCYLEGGHLGYYNLGVFVNRRIVHIKPDIYVLFDEFYGAGAHSYNQYFNFSNEGSLSLLQAGAEYKSTRNHVEIKLLSKVDAEIIPSHFSRNYNKLEKSSALKTSFTTDGFASAITLISVNKAGEVVPVIAEKLNVTSNFKGITFEDKLIEAVKVSKGEREYIVVAAHQEYASPTDSFCAGGVIGFGNTVVFDTAKGENRIGTVLTV